MAMHAAILWALCIGIAIHVKWVARSLDIVMSLADDTTSVLSSFWYLISSIIDFRVILLILEHLQQIIDGTWDAIVVVLKDI